MDKKPQYTIDDVMSPAEAADRFGISLNTLGTYLRGNRLAVVDVDAEIEAGRVRRFMPATGTRAMWYVTTDFIERYFNVDGTTKSK